MESFGHSKIILSDFEFKYIPQSSFERVVREVEEERKSRNKGMWGNFCTVSSELEDADIIKKSYVLSPKQMNDHFLSSGLDEYSFDAFTVLNNRHVMPSTAAPLFGPPRKYNPKKFQPVRDEVKQPNKLKSMQVTEIKSKHPFKIEAKQDKKNRNKDELDFESPPSTSVHIDDAEDIDAELERRHDQLMEYLKNQKRRASDKKNKKAKQITANDDVNDEKSSNEFSSDNDDSYYSEVLELCNEIGYFEGKEEAKMLEEDEKTHLKDESHEPEKEEEAKFVYKVLGSEADDVIDHFLEEEETMQSLLHTRFKNGELPRGVVEDFKVETHDLLRTENYDRETGASINKFPKFISDLTVNGIKKNIEKPILKKLERPEFRCGEKPDLSAIAQNMMSREALQRIRPTCAGKSNSPVERPQFRNGPSPNEGSRNITEEAQSRDRPQYKNSIIKRNGNNNENIHDNEQSHGDYEDAPSRPYSHESTESLAISVEIHRGDEYLEKICEYLDRIQDIIDNPPELDSIGDLNKRQKRSNEFTTRFARNHLYQIGRSAEKLRLMRDNPMELASKVNSLFYIILQAVRTYLRNIEMFIHNKNPDKLLVLVDFIINASKICFDRKVFDKKDALVMKMLRICAEMREFLNYNRDSKATYYESPRNKRVTDEVDDDFDEHPVQKKVTVPKKLKNPYGMPSNSYGMRNTYGMSRIENSRYTLNSLHPKSPYERSKNPYDNTSMKMKAKSSARINTGKNSARVTPPKNAKSSALHAGKSRYVGEVSGKDQKSSRPIKNTNAREGSQKSTRSSELQAGKSRYIGEVSTEEMKKPHTILRNSSSNVSTVMQKEMEKDNELKIIQTVSEKPLENENESASEIMKMIQNITKEKFEEMFAPLLAQLMPKTDNKSTKNEEIKSSVSRVTADVEPLKKSIEEPERPNSSETIQRVAHNVQYLFIKSLNEDADDEEKNKQEQLPKAEKQLTLVEPLSIPKAGEKINVKIIEKPPTPSCNIDSSKSENEDDEDDQHKLTVEELRELAVKERLACIESMSTNPLYVNEHVKEPWNLLNNISDEVLDEMIESVLKKLNIEDGEILESFLKCELAF